MLYRFAYLKYSLSVLLVFIGSKIFIADAMGWEKFPPEWSLGLTFAILAAGVIYSLRRTAMNPEIQYSRVSATTAVSLTPPRLTI